MMTRFEDLDSSDYRDYDEASGTAVCPHGVRVMFGDECGRCTGEDRS